MKHASATTRQYGLHGIGISFTSNNQFLHSAIDRLLSQCGNGQLDCSSNIHIALFDQPDICSRPVSKGAGGEPICATSENDLLDIRETGLECLKIFRSNVGTGFYLNYGKRGGIAFEPEKLRAEGYVLDPESLAPQVICSHVFLFVFMRLMEKLGYFHIHCGSVARRGRGILIPGFSGAGKTTTCIALARAGFDFLSDDRGFLRREKDGKLRFWAFPEQVNATRQTMEFFPEIKEHAEFLFPTGGVKKSFRMEKVFATTRGESGVPRAIFFPQIGSKDRSSLAPMGKGEALGLFLPHTMLVIDKDIARRHFELLSDLIDSTNCYRLSLGRDFDHMARLAESVLRP